MAPISPCFTDLDTACQHKIFNHLTAAEAARSMLVDKYWKNALMDDHMWKCFAEEDWALTRPSNFDGSPSPSYRTAYADWHQELGKYSGPDRLPQRAARVWRDIRRWTAENTPEIATTLQPGFAETSFDLLAVLSNNLLPPALKIQYRFCGGQEQHEVQAREPGVHPVGYKLINGLGLFGGCLIPTRPTSFLGAFFMTPYMSHLLLPAAGIDASHSIPFAGLGWGDMDYAVHLPTGRIQIVRGNGEPLFVSPEGHGMMEWMEEFAHRLVSGAYQPISIRLWPLDNQVSHGVRCLSRFPQTAEAGMLEAVTQGVRVRVASALLPSTSIVAECVEMVYAYRMSFCLLPAEQQRQSWPASNGPFLPRSQVQLSSHSLKVEDCGSNDVRKTFLDISPVLIAGGPEQVYSAFVPISPMRGQSAVLSGQCSFVEGLVLHPSGPAFTVQCPSLEISPSYTA